MRDKRPSHPAPNVRGDRDTPLSIGRETRGKLPVICPSSQANDLRHNGTTGKSPGDAQIAVNRNLRLPRFSLRIPSRQLFAA